MRSIAVVSYIVFIVLFINDDPERMSIKTNNILYNEFINIFLLFIFFF